MATGEPIAIVGMAGRFPGAEDIDEFADNLFNAREGISDLPDDIPFIRGVKEEYVRRRPIITDADCFDADFFAMTPREAELRDPHHRLFLETTHATLAHAGYDPSTYAGRIGVFAGMNANRYRHDYLEAHPDLVQQAGYLVIDNSSAPDYLTTFVSYKLGLRGPSVTTLTACSTALVSVHLACTAIRAGDCDMAVAGGVSVEFPFNRGYFYYPGGTSSKDGVVRPFDEHSTGTNFGNGVGAVLLKPLSAAIADRDTVYAVVRGSAINNDGNRKVGFSAPSIDGQRECIEAALRSAEVDPRDISYMEAHGTGTPVGDPIELTGLVEAYRAVGGDELPTGYCALGTVKSNVGHLGHAAGVAGLIKTVLALHFERLPASINVTTPTTAVDWDTSPFRLVTETRPWPETDDAPRVAAVSSFGIGGTNAHVIVGAAPAPEPRDRPARPTEAILWSATDDAAGDRLRERLRTYFATLPVSRFADAAHTLRTGRSQKKVRGAVLAASPADAAESLGDSWRIISGDGRPRSLAFAFPGQGSQFANAMIDLYADEPLFRAGCDNAFEVLAPLVDTDLRAAWESGDEDRLAETAVAQPLLYVLEYTLAHCLRHWGATPTVLFGHSIGELVAGAVAGVFDFESGLRAVAARARLMQEMPRGRMLAVAASRDDVAEFVTGPVALAAVNGPRQVVLSGPADAIDAAAAELSGRGLATKALRTSHAFHSPAMADAADRWEEVLAGLDLREPRLPIVSAATGTEIDADQARSPRFWAQQLTAPVDFDAAAAAVLATGPVTVLEVGPGRTVGALLRGRAELRVEGSCALPLAPRAGGTAVEPALAQLWVDGEPITYWQDLGRRGGYRRTAVPGYPYARRRHWVDPPTEPDETPEPADRPTTQTTTEATTEVSSPFAELAWTSTTVDRASAEPALAHRGTAAVLCGCGDDRLVPALQRAGYRAVVLDPTPGAFDPTSAPAWIAALDRLGDVDLVVHAALLAAPDTVTATELDEQLSQSVYGVVACVRALATAARRLRHPVALVVAGRHLVDVTGGETINPAAAAVVPLLRTIHAEHPDIATHCLDVSPNTPEDVLAAELADLRAPLLAVRGTARWSPFLRPLPEPSAAPRLRHRGTYLITGGLSGIGLVAAKTLARTGMRPRLALLSRSADAALPELAELTAAGAEVEVVPADVTDLESLRAAVTRVERRFGQLAGVVHSAGVAGGGLVERREPEEIRRVLAPKTLGVLNLETVLADRPELDFLMLFSSQAGLGGLYGSADYAAANAFLDAHARSVAGRERRTLSVQWPGWSEVGMAARSDVEIGALTGATGSALERPSLTSDYDPAGSWEFTEHVVAGTPVLPGTSLLDLIVRAVRTAGVVPASEALELRDTVFLSPVVGDGPVEVNVLLTALAEGYRTRVRSRRPGASAWTDHAQGTVVGIPDQPGALPEDVRDGLPPSPFGGLGEWIRFGERWETVTDFRSSGDERLARLVLPEKFADDLATHVLHPALLDVATGVSTDVRPGKSYVPFLYRRMRVFGSLSGDLTVHTRPIEPADGAAGVRPTAVDIYDTETETMLVQVEGFAVREVNEAWASGQPTISAAPPEPGLVDPDTGARLIRQLLAGHLPAVVLVSAPNAPAIPGFDQVASPVTTTAPVAAPDVAAQPEPVPATDTADAATVLRELWSKALGIGDIKDDDDFFDLGGSSLTAVALTSHIRDHFGVELSAGVMFELSTIRAMVAELTK
jgi:acyl transferase domain-containing protein/acyl carrier protein